MCRHIALYRYCIFVLTIGSTSVNLLHEVCLSVDRSLGLLLIEGHATSTLVLAIESNQARREDFPQIDLHGAKTPGDGRGLRNILLADSWKNVTGRCGKTFVRFLTCGMLCCTGRMATSLL